MNLDQHLDYFKENFSYNVNETSDSFSLNRVDSSIDQWHGDVLVKIDNYVINFSELTNGEIDLLKEKARLSVCGKGEKTVFDLEIRKSFSLNLSSSAKTNIENHFKDKSKKLVNTLEIEENFTLELHDLVIFEKGGFFKPHRDSEKNSQMVATLVAVCPTECEGGSFVVNGKEDFQKNSLIIFYPDCLHEVKEVLEGNKVLFVFNVIGKYKKVCIDKNVLDIFSKNIHLKDVSNYRYDNREIDLGIASTPNYFFLKHLYTQPSLQWHSLKGEDAVNVALLKHAAQQQYCNYYLSLLIVNAEYEYDDDPNNDFRPCLFPSNKKISVNTLCWIDRNNNKLFDMPNNVVPLQKVWGNCKDFEVIKSSDDFPPGLIYKFEDVIGNWGLKRELWYHKAAFVWVIK
jgi:hypothetical protein